MIKKSVLSILFLVSILVSCQKEASDVDQAVNIRGGNCLLKKVTSSVLCIDYKADSDVNTNSANCDAELTRYASVGANGKSWTSGSNNTCATATSATIVGNCARTDGSIIRYYSADFSTGSSQTDCTSVHNGTHTP